MKIEEIKSAGKNEAKQRLFAVIDNSGKTVVQVWASEGNIDRIVSEILGSE